MKRLVNRQLFFVIVGSVTLLSLFAMTASAQEEVRSQVNLQLMGVFPNDSTGNGVTDHATRSGGMRVGYTYMFNKWAGAEGAYAWNRDTQSYSDAFGGISTVQSNINQMTGAFVVKPAIHSARVQPFLLAGSGIVRFSPTTNEANLFGALSQTKAAFVYGGGADFFVSSKIGVRADYRGMLTRTPDFKLSSLTLDTNTHLAQPSLGIYFRF